MSATATPAAVAAGGPRIVFARASARLFRRPFTRTYVWSGLKISGTVYDNGARGANQTVTATSSDGPGAQAITNATGHFTLELPRSGSRVVQITTPGGAPVILKERVRATMIVKVRALKGYRLVFTGWILTSWQRGEGGLPWVIVQDQTPVGWSTIGAASVGAGGRYRVTYRALPADAGTWFAFRAITGRGPTWLAGSTGTHWATVW
ncbi:MAG: carboxypeptidase-like regulatory domain-containing protein [Solirubrobacteraceae bacterium]